MIVIFILCISSLLASMGEDSPTLNCTEFCIDRCNPSFENCLRTCETAGWITKDSQAFNRSGENYPYYELSWTGTYPIMCQSDLFFYFKYSNAYYYIQEDPDARSSTTTTFDVKAPFEDANEYVCRDTGAAPSNQCNYGQDSRIYEYICSQNSGTCFNTFYCRNATTDPSLFPWGFTYGLCVCGDSLKYFEYMDVLEPFVGGSSYFRGHLAEVEAWCSMYNESIETNPPTTYPTLSSHEHSKATHLDKTITWILVGIFILV